MFPGVISTINQHWFRKWLGAKNATSHYINQRWHGYMLHSASMRSLIPQYYYKSGGQRRKTLGHFSTTNTYTITSLPQLPHLPRVGCLLTNTAWMPWVSFGCRMDLGRFVVEAYHEAYGLVFGVFLIVRCHIITLWNCSITRL